MKSVDSTTKKTGIIAKAANLISGLSKRQQDEPPKENQPELQLISLVDQYRGIPEIVNRGRKQEIQDVFDILQKKVQHNIVLMGPFGVGKSSIVEAVAEHIAKGTCPESFKDTKIVQLLAEDLNPELNSAENIAAKVAGLIEYLKSHPHHILYIKEFDLICEYGFLEHFKVIFSNFRFISTLDDAKYDKKLFEEDEFMLTHFEILNIDEPPREELYDMLEYPISELSKYHKVSITKEDVELIMDIIYRKNFTILPWNVLNTIDYVMGVCTNHGLDHVIPKAIFEQSRHYFQAYFEVPPEKVKVVAYHEVGHCIVGKACGIKSYGIQIIPESNTLGSNYFSYGLAGVLSRSDYMNIICTSLAGELSTKRKGYETIDGISSDISKASACARSMVTTFGMEDLHLMSYVAHDQIAAMYFSDEIRERIDTKARDILREAIERTEKILEENADKIEILASALLKKGFLTASEVDGLLEEAETGKKISIDSLPSIKDLLFD